MSTVRFERLLQDDPDAMPVEAIGAQEELVRVYWSVDGHTTPNPGVGSTRFAPFPGTGAHAGLMVPTMYFARTLRAALLETVFHAVTIAPGTPPRSPAVVTGNDLLGRLHGRLVLPREVRLLDLRNPALSGLGFSRDQVVSSPALHYPCTQRIAKAAHDAVPGGGGFDGIIWHSRQTELAALSSAAEGTSVSPGGTADDEVIVLFGSRVAGGRTGGWAVAAAPDSNGSLFEGTGLRHVIDLAVELGAAIDVNVDGS